MSIKTIFVPFQGREEEQGAILTAFRLAQNIQAHVEVWHISPDPYDILTPFVTYGQAPIYPESTIEELKRSNAKRWEKVEESFSTLAHKAGIVIGGASGGNATLHHIDGNIEEMIGIRARLADITIVGRDIQDSYGSSTGILHRLIFHSGRPVIVVPSGAAAFNLDENVMIAWNGSAESSRALYSSLPFLKEDNTFVLSVLTDSDDFPISQSELKPYMERHGINPKFIEYDVKRSELPECMMSTAKAHKTSLFVMGAYSHSRLQEVFFGGVTKFMLEHATIPVLLSH